jgi:homocitrate synthase NifV
MTKPKPLWKLEPNDLVEKNIPVSKLKLDRDQHQKIRITGLDDLMTRDYPAIFKALLDSGIDTLDLCPGNHHHCATAIALEWVLAGGASFSCGFANHHHFASLEEVLMGLKLHQPDTFSGDLSVLCELRCLYEKCFGQPVAKTKAIIGADIFKVESGIHVDGVLKNPSTYEPFNPQTVGNQREIVLGKHSGRKSLLYKLNDPGLSESTAHFILKQIKSRCTQLGRNLSDLELQTLASEVQNDKKIYC